MRDRGWQHEYEGTRQVVEIVFPDALRKKGVSQKQIVDLGMAIDSATTVNLLVGRCGWPLAEYEAWLVDFLASFLKPVSGQ